MMRIIDIAETAKLFHALCPAATVVVDNTFASPCAQVCDADARSLTGAISLPRAVDNCALCTVHCTYCIIVVLIVEQRPLELGADVVWHSCTKYLNGHSDVVMGALCTNDAQLDEKLKFQQKGANSSRAACCLRASIVYIVQ